MAELKVCPIAHIRSDFPEKFGVPRQSGLINELESVIVFEPQYRDRNAFNGLSDYSHLWLIWHFSLFSSGEKWSPTVRPPRLGGNKRMGVFATRSPNRPNPLGLSSVRLERIEYDTPDGPLIYVSGADLVDGTPIFDIKPYLPFTDSHPDASGGFTDDTSKYSAQVSIPAELLNKIPENKQTALIEILKSDPRPGYQNDPFRVYGFDFAGYSVGFIARNGTLTVTKISPKNNK